MPRYGPMAIMAIAASHEYTYLEFDLGDISKPFLKGRFLIPGRKAREG